MKTKKILLIIEISLIIILAGTLYVSEDIKNYFYRKKIDRENQMTKEQIEQIENTEIITKIERTASNNEKKQNTGETQISIPAQKYLEVPFICQAPLETEANWIHHEESCEEAALLQAYLYETNKTITKNEANEQILDMISWQEKNFGGHHDLYADEMKNFITGYLGLDESEVKIVYNAEISDLKSEIAKGHPVIVPITGEILQNPYYPYPGYHMLTAIGYTEKRIITNDNGTRRGADFSYDIEIFSQAMKDAGSDILVLNLQEN